MTGGLKNIKTEEFSSSEQLDRPYRRERVYKNSNSGLT
jgi:hypothetical protein